MQWSIQEWIIRTNLDFCICSSCARFSRFCRTSSFRASFSACVRIKHRCIPTRKHLANRQQLQIRRDSCATSQSPSARQTKSIV